MSDDATRPHHPAIPADRLPTLDTPRLRLRWLEERDVDDLYAIFSDPEVMRYWSSPPYTGRAQAEELLAGIGECFRGGGLYQWGVARRADDRVIGTCTLAGIDRSNLRAEIGFALGRAHWGGGLMIEATSGLLDFAFGPLGLARMEADVDPNNHASLRLLEKLGFQREGYMRERWRVGGGVQDSVFLGLLAREWPAAREALARPRAT